MKPVSLRARLIKTLLFQLSATGILAGGLALFFIFHEVDEVYDATLVQFARSLATMPDVDSAPETYAGMERTRNAILAHKYERKISYRIMRGDQVQSVSADAPILANLYPPSGFSDHQIKNDKWRIFTLLDEKTGRTIEVAEQYHIRRELTSQLLSSLLLPGALFIIGALVAIWWGTAYGLRQVTSVSTQVNRRAIDDLSPIDEHAIPLEIRPLTEALNALFLRITSSFAREREFTDNAAHELRTPLAAMKTQAQVLLKSENLSDSGRDGLDNLVAAIDRAAGMIEGLLSFARLQADNTPKSAASMTHIIQSEVRNLQSFADSKDIQIHLNISQDCQIYAAESAIALLIRNLLNNAVKFTPKHGRVDIHLEENQIGIYLRIEDTGTGISLEHEPRIFDRFYRADKSSTSGSGLGLSMAKWVADMHDAQITFKNRTAGGASFSVQFPKHK